MQKNLHMSKKSSIFAVDLKRSPLSSLKWFTNMYLTYSRLCLIHICENCCKVSKKFLNTQIIMEKKFINSNCLINLQFYGVNLRLDVVLVDDKAYIWIVTRRTSSTRVDFTQSFAEYKDACSQLKIFISELHTSIFGF